MPSFNELVFMAERRLGPFSVHRGKKPLQAGSSGNLIGRAVFENVGQALEAVQAVARKKLGPGTGGSPPPSTMTTVIPSQPVQTSMAIANGGPQFFPTGGGQPAGGGGFVGELGEFVGIIERGVNVARQIKQLAGGNGGGGGSKALIATQSAGTADKCPTGSVRIGNTCVTPGDLFPGGDPAFTAAGGNAVAGSFGLPAMTPLIEQRTHRECPTGMVLGRDNLCYPKQILPRRSNFRKWKGAPRPALSAADMKALRKADRLQEKIKRINKMADMKVPSRRKRR